MTLIIEDVKAGEWLTCTQGDGLLSAGEDYRVERVEHGTVILDMREYGEGIGQINRFTRRPFRAGDLVEMAINHLPTLREGDRCLIACVESLAKYATLQTERFEAVQDVPVEKLRLVTPAHLAATPQQDEPEQAEPDLKKAIAEARATIERRSPKMKFEIGFEVKQAEPSDAVNHPSHYTSHPSGVECIEITQHMNFCLGNAMKYIWRAGEKGKETEDLRKAVWYLNREIERLEKQREKGGAT